jgi:hypothetical protein
LALVVALSDGGSTELLEPIPLRGGNEAAIDLLRSLTIIGSELGR